MLKAIEFIILLVTKITTCYEKGIVEDASFLRNQAHFLTCGNFEEIVQHVLDI